MKSLAKTLVVLLTLGVVAQHASADEMPNVLFIAVDDLRDWVGHLDGNQQAKTPNLDRLAQRGVSFSHAHCAAPLCNPSRISLLTGVAPANSGVYGNGENLRDKLPDAITLMQHFRNSGYVVRGSGKIFHGWNAYDKESWDDYFVPAQVRAKSGSQRDRILPKTAWTPWGEVDLSDEEMFDGKVASWAVSELEKSHDKPFFLACGFTKPHLPWIVPRKYFRMYPLDGISLPPTVDGDLADVPAFGKRLAREVFDPSGEKNFATPGGDHFNIIANGQWRNAVQAYLATISFADSQIGRVLDALENSRHADNTIIVLWGDHGWHLGEKEHWRKHALWNVSTQTPLIFAGPSKSGAKRGIAKDQVCERPVSLIDIYPTLIDLCGLPQRDGLNGRSLQSLLKNPEQQWDHPVVITFGLNNHAIQTQRWRYIRYADGGEELYDHDNDPNEWMNLASSSNYKMIILNLKTHLPVRNMR
ncbi:sulfatase [Rubripirellula sp.]|nr:sulfatase [Rubripirellula sp.]MDA7915050.1 sulfatase [bacterium]MDB4645010.1 sulfatase [Rubripirellula sp.]